MPCPAPTPQQHWLKHAATASFPSLTYTFKHTTYHMALTPALAPPPQPPPPPCLHIPMPPHAVQNPIYHPEKFTWLVLGLKKHHIAKPLCGPKCLRTRPTPDFSLTPAHPTLSYQPTACPLPQSPSIHQHLHGSFPASKDTTLPAPCVGPKCRVNLYPRV
jgi:hypothetical protein